MPRVESMWLPHGCHYPANLRHQENIAERWNTRAAKSVLCKTQDERIGVIVPAAILPKVVAGLRPGLHHSQRAGSGRGGVTGVIRADERIDEARLI